MDKVLFNKYVDERYNGQMKFYSEKSKFNQTRYKKFQWALIILSAVTPVMAALMGKTVSIGSFKWAPDLQILVVIISAIVAILTTGLKTFNYQDLWINYRSTYENLKPEIHYYNFGIGPYAEPGIDKESLFVTRVEALLDAEHKQWPPAKKEQEDKNKPAGEGTDGKENGTAKDAENEDGTQAAANGTAKNTQPTNTSSGTQAEAPAATGQTTADASISATTDAGAGIVTNTEADATNEADEEESTK